MDIDKLISIYKKNSIDIKKMMEVCDATKEEVYEALNNHIDKCIRIGKRSKPYIFSEKQKDRIHNSYFYEFKTMDEIAKKLCVTRDVVDRILRENSHVRKASEQARFRYIVGIRQVSEEHRSSLSQAHKGANHHNHILTDEDVLNIRQEFDRLYGEGNKKTATYRLLGEKYGVTYHTIFAIVKRKIWKHL